MKLGTENKKAVYTLAVLGVIVLYGVYSNFLAGPDVPSSSSSASPTAAARPTLPAPAAEAPARPSGQRAPNLSGRSEEFRPVLRSKRPEERIDPNSVDPTLRLDLLAKVQNEEPPKGTRNLFQFAEKPKPVELAKGPEPKIVRPFGPTPLPPPVVPPKPVDPADIPPPPINVRYYGFATPSNTGKRRGFFMDGEDILIMKEGDTLKGHYKVVRLGANSVVVEDTNSKRQQTLPMAEDAQG